MEQYGFRKFDSPLLQQPEAQQSALDYRPIANLFGTIPALEIFSLVETGPWERVTETLQS